MADIDPKDVDGAAVEKVQRVVNSDHERVLDAEDPWTVLGLESGASGEKINEQFERYEQFYRAENFKRFDDKNLTRKALEIRKLVSRAVVELQAARDDTSNAPRSAPPLQSIDPDSQALADVYFRDGITWMKLEDLDAAIECFQLSLDYNPNSGVTLAYHTYARFRRGQNDAEAVKECRESFKTAELIEPKHPEVHVLKARFALQTHNSEMAKRSIDRVRTLEPSHPALGELRRLYDELTM